MPDDDNNDDNDTNSNNNNATTKLPIDRDTRLSIDRDNTRNAVQARRDNYFKDLSETYTQSYGSKWLSAQPGGIQQRVRQRTAAYVKHGLTNLAALTCLGPEKCPFYTQCPIPDVPGSKLPISSYPVNNPCVLESEYVSHRVVDYLTELEADPYNPVEMGLIQELALLDLLRNRAVLILSNGDLRGHGRDMMSIDEQFADFSAEGEPIMNLSSKVHPAVEVMEKHEKRRGKILEQFVATRASKYKLSGGHVESNTELFHTINTIKQYMESLAKQGVAITMDGSGSGSNTQAQTVPVMLIQPPEKLPRRVLETDTTTTTTTYQVDEVDDSSSQLEGIV